MFKSMRAMFKNDASDNYLKISIGSALTIEIKGFSELMSLLMLLLVLLYVC
jgi:hypothetical protein